MKYIITGSRGLIGEKLVKRLKGECVRQVDVRLGSNVLNLKPKKADIFFHLAAHCNINQGTNDPTLPFMNNVGGTFEALEFCRQNNIKKFVYFSSSRTLSKEENPYTASKKYGEVLCEAYKQCYGIEYLIVRPSTVYGERHDLTNRLINKWVLNALNGKALKLYGDKNKTLDFTHLDDFLDGLELLLKNWKTSKNKAFDISGNDNRRLIELVSIIEKEVGRYLEIEYNSPEIAQPQQVKININKIKKLGYKPKIKLEEGIKRLVNFYRNEGKKYLN